MGSATDMIVTKNYDQNSKIAARHRAAAICRRG
jgi:hypothetical protein